MEESFDSPLDANVIAASLRMDQSSTGDLLESLAEQLQGWLPENIKIVRGGWFLSAKRPVKELTVSFTDCQLKLTADERGSREAFVVKVVRGVALKTEKIAIQAWVNLLAQELVRTAQSNAQMRDTLSKFVIG